MKDLLKTLKLWETIFIVFCIIGLYFIEFLLLSFLPLMLFGIIPSILAFKEKKYYIILINVLIPIASLALYFYLW